MGDHTVGRSGVGLVVGWGDPAMTESVGASGFAFPTGTVAFLLTDVEGSTRLWESEPDAMAKAIDRHNEILDAAVSAHDGVRPTAQGEGDSIVAAFSRASAAVLAAVEAQQALTAEAWPTDAPVRVRIAVHAGEARTVSDGNYAGQAIIRTARLRAIAHGGQVLVSGPARDLVVDHLGDQVRLVDLGEHRLRDLARPERVYQATGPGLADGFETLKSLDAHRHNLPVQLSSFIGRVDEIATVVDLVRRNRLVTIVGTGGAGKTRLALQAAAELVDGANDGTWWVELQDVRDPEHVVAAIGGAIGVRGEVGEGAEDALAHVLAEQDMLLVVDNCEHLVDAVALTLDRLLRGCPGLRVLATSREALQLSGEVAWRIPPLSVPSVDAPPVPAVGLSRYEGVRLFLDRAQRTRPGFTVDETNAAAVAAICHRLDGVPLAIELAAARSRSMTPAQIHEGLTDAFRVLSGTTRGALPRQATLEASISWSHELLTEPEQALIRRLSVFAGGCTLDAAEAVCSDDELVPRLAVLDLLDRLVVQSLLVLDDQGDLPRYRLLETVRQYAAHRLDDAGETARVEDLHMRHYHGLLLDVWPSFREVATAYAGRYRRTTPELDNVRVALDHAARQERWEDYATMAVRAGLPLIDFQPAQAAAILDRIPEGTIESAALRAEVAWVVGFAPSLGGDPRTLDEWQRAKELSAGGVHPFLEVVATQSLFAAKAHITPGLGITLVEDAAAASRASGEPLVEVVRLGNAIALRGVIRGEVELAETHLNDLDGYRAGFGRTDPFLAADAWSAIVAWYAGDLDIVDARCDRVEQALADRLPRGTSYARHLGWIGGFARAARGLAASARGEVRLSSLLASFELARRQQLGATTGLLGLAVGAAQLALGLPEAATATFDAVEAFAPTPSLVATAAAYGARSALASGDTDGSRRRGKVAREIAELHGLSFVDGLLRAFRGALGLTEGDPSARSTALDALDYTAAHGYKLLQVDMLEVLVALETDGQEAARRAGAISRAREDLGYRMRFSDVRGRVDAAIDTARAALGDDAFEAAFAEGNRLRLEETVAYVLRSRGERKRPARGWASLTPTERAVVEQVTVGLTNPQIAERLLMSRDTVKTHLSHIYAKLGVKNRTELTVEAHKSSTASSE